MPQANPISEAISPAGAVKQAAEEKARADRAAIAGTQRKADEEVFARLQSKPVPVAAAADDEEEAAEDAPQTRKTKKAAPEEITSKAADEGSDEEEVGETAYNKAVTLANRFGITADTIAGMPKKHVIALAKTLQARQSERDDIFRQLQEAKSRETASPKSESSAHRERGADKDAPDDEVETLIAPFNNDSYGDDVKESMRAFGKNVVAYQKKLEAALHQQVALANDMAGEVLLDSVCAKFAGRYPELDTEAGVAKARAKAFTLLKTGDYDTIDGVRARLASAMDDAVRNIWGKRREKSAEASKAKDESAMRDGTPSINGLRKSPQALDGEDADMAAFVSLAKGGNTRDARLAMHAMR